MSLSPTIDLAPSTRVDAAPTRRRGVWIGVAIVVAAIALQARGYVNADTSWFMTFAEKVLDGATPYVDIADPNPPAAFVAYIPAVALSRLVHLRAEAMVVALTMVGALASLGASIEILRRSGLLRGEDVVSAFDAGAVALLLAPGLCFAEREHFVLILLLPFLAVCASRMAEAPVATYAALLAGTVAALALAFKPYYALPIALCALAAPVALRRARGLLAGELVALAIASAIVGAATLLFCPAYLPMLRLGAGIYAPAHEAWSVVLRTPPFLATLALLAAVAMSPEARRDPRATIAGLGSVGFTATYLVQAKGWMNHAYPEFALALIAVAVAALEARSEASRRRVRMLVFLPGCVAAPLFMGALIDLGQTDEHPGLRASLARLAPSHPRVAALAQELGIGHPLVRQLDGTWVGRQNCLWLAYAANVARVATRDPYRRARLQALIDQDAADFAADITGGRPDVLLIESRELETWARRQPSLAPMFREFIQAAEADGVEIWLRRSASETGAVKPAPAPQLPRP